MAQMFLPHATKLRLLAFGQALIGRLILYKSAFLIEEYFINGSFRGKDT